jgi:hypothetical protein
MNVLDEQDGLRLVHEYETVILQGAEVPNVIVGDHYGDPIGGLIDREGAWVASFGEGVQVYRIAKPHTPYEREVESGQWVTWDAPKDLGYEVHVSGVRQDQDGRLVISVAGDEPFDVSIEVWLSKGSIDLVADGQSVRETGADTLGATADPLRVER